MKTFQHSQKGSQDHNIAETMVLLCQESLTSLFAPSWKSFNQKEGVSNPRVDYLLHRKFASNFSDPNK